MTSNFSLEKYNEKSEPCGSLFSIVIYGDTYFTCLNPVLEDAAAALSWKA